MPKTRKKIKTAIVNQELEVMLIGRLVEKPSKGEPTLCGKTTANLTLVTRFKDTLPDQDAGLHTDRHEVQVTGAVAERCLEKLDKDSRVLVIGKRWTNDLSVPTIIHGFEVTWLGTAEKPTAIGEGTMV